LKQTTLECKPNLTPSAPNLFTLVVKPIPQLIAINSHHLQAVLSEHMMCNNSKHSMNIVLKNNNISSSCNCNKIVAIQGTSEISYANRMNIVIFVSKQNITTILDNTKQKCGYIAKLKFHPDKIEIYCGHHPNCLNITIFTMGFLQLIDK